MYPAQSSVDPSLVDEDNKRSHRSRPGNMISIAVPPESIGPPSGKPWERNRKDLFTVRVRRLTPGFPEWLFCIKHRSFCYRDTLLWPNGPFLESNTCRSTKTPRFVLHIRDSLSLRCAPACLRQLGFGDSPIVSPVLESRPFLS